MEIPGAVNADSIIETVVITSRVVRCDETRPAELVRHHVTVSVLLPLPPIVASLDDCDPAQRRSRARMEHAVTVDDAKRLDESQHGEERAHRSWLETLEGGPGKEAVVEPGVEDQIDRRC